MANYACVDTKLCFLFIWGYQRIPRAVYRLDLGHDSEVCANRGVCNFRILKDPRWGWLAQLSRTLAEIPYLAKVIGIMGIIVFLCVKGIQRSYTLISRVPVRSLRWALILLKMTLLWPGLVLATSYVPLFFLFKFFLVDRITWPSIAALITAFSVSYLIGKSRSKKHLR